MADESVELVRWLFASATVLLEGASDIALSGQSPKRDVIELRECAHELHTAAQDITTLAAAIAIIAQLSDDPPTSA